MPGFDNNTVYADNVDFRGVQPVVGQMTTDGQLLIGSTSTPHIKAGSLSFNANMNVATGSGTITLNPYNTAKLIVDPIANIGTHTTITSALAAASSGDTIFIRPGTYTENLTLKAGVNLTAFECDNNSTSVVILGTTTASYNGESNISGIRFQTNGSTAISFSGSNATVLNLFNCYIFASNSNGITFNAANSGARFFSCSIAASATFKIFDIISVSGISIYQGAMSNVDSTASTMAAGVLNIYGADINSVFSTSSAASMNVFGGKWTDNSTNTTVLTTSGTGSFSIYNCFISSGSASSISIGSGTSLTISDCIIISSNTNAISGAGILNLGSITFAGTSSNISTSTVNGYTEQHGNILRGTSSLTLIPLNNATGDGGTSLIIGGTTTNSGSSGGVGSVQGGSGNGTGSGGLASVVGGLPGATGSGGNVLISGGPGGSTSGIGGGVFITGGTGSGTNTNSQDMLITNTVGTGTGVTGHIQLRCDAQGGTSGSTAHTSVPRLVLNGFTSLTSGIGANLMTVTLPTNGTAAGTLFYAIDCTNGTEYQSVSGVVAYAFTSKAGTIAGSTSVIGTEAKNLTSGTLNTAWAGNAGGGVQVTATSSISPTLLRITYNVFSGSQQNISVN